ncbi:MFS transporter [Chloroflexota bacterium]
MFNKLNYGWIIVILGNLILMTNSLAVFGFGVFLKPIISEFGWERGSISGAFSIGILVNGFLSIATGRLSDRYGARILVTIGGLSLSTAFFLMSRINSIWQIYLVWGLFVGTALSCSAIPIITTITRWFTKRRGLAMAVVGIGFSLGSMITPILIQWLVSSYGWRQSFLILGFIPIILTTVTAQFIKKETPSLGKDTQEENIENGNQTNQDATDGLSLSQAVVTWRFWIFALTHFGIGFCLQMIIVHVVPHAIDIGIPEIAAASTLSIIAGSSFASRFLAGPLSDKTSGRKVIAGSLILLTLSFILLIFVNNYISFIIFSVIYGLAHGGIVTVLAIIVPELFGLRHIGAIWGVILLCGTLGGAVGAPISGIIFDTTKSYDISFYVGISVAGLSTILSLILLRLSKK